MITFLRYVIKLQILTIFIAIIVTIYYPNLIYQMKAAIFGYNILDKQNSYETTPIGVHFSGDDGSSSSLQTDRLFTLEELATYNGEGENEKMPLYLALLGSVYDVSKGVKHYGPGCSYNYFVGRDASVSFVTGHFEQYDEQTADDILTLKPSDLLSLANWKSFYDKDYIYKGKLIGRFYDENGVRTPYHHKYLALVEQATQAKDNNDQLRILYPDCNIEWSQAKGTRVWCTPTSGGQQRKWSGHPRKLFEVNNGKADSFRCACIRTDEINTAAAMIKPYDNCEALATECFYRI